MDSSVVIPDERYVRETNVTLGLRDQALDSVLGALRKADRRVIPTGL